MKIPRAQQIQMLIENEINRVRTQSRFAILPTHPVYSEQTENADTYCAFYLKTLECLENAKKGTTE